MLSVTVGTIPEPRKEQTMATAKKKTGDLYAVYITGSTDETPGYVVRAKDIDEAQNIFEDYWADSFGPLTVILLSDRGKRYEQKWVEVDD